MRNWLAVFTILALNLGVACASHALTGREIMEKVDARDDGDNLVATLQYELIDRDGHKRFKTTRLFSKDRGRDTLKLSFFTAPADVKGAGFLTHDYREPDRDDDQWLYLPELKKIKRIASSDKSSSFMGTDFSYADMTNRVLDEWSYKYLKDMEVRGHKCWLVEALPASRQVEERYGYTKSVLFVRQDNFVVVRAVHWVKDGRKLKYLDVPALEQVDGVWTSTQLIMRTVKAEKTLHTTVITWQDIKYNQPLDLSMFKPPVLEKGL